MSRHGEYGRASMDQHAQAHGRAATTAGSTSSSGTQRIIIALDLDAFYVAASRKRDPSLVGLPVGIKQKHILATASYEARARGVRKLALIKDAVRSCPELVLVNGEDLSYFRDVSAEVFRVVSHNVPGAPVEKLGMDELFIDATEIVTEAQARVLAGHSGDVAWLASLDECEDPAWRPHGVILPDTTAHVLGSQQPSFASSIDPHAHRLLLASHLARFIRQRVSEDVGLTSSAGIADSKLLAKLVGNTHKPNRQTVLAPLGIQASVPNDKQRFLDPFALRSLNGFGSAIVTKMCSFAIKALGAPEDAFDTKQLTVLLANQIFDQSTLDSLFGSRLAQRLFDLLHARDDDPVIPAPLYPAQISIEDTYQGLPFSQAYAQFLVLGESLLRRLEKEIVMFKASLTRGPALPSQEARFRLVMQAYDSVGDPLPSSVDVASAPMKVRDYEDLASEAPQEDQRGKSHYQWLRYPLTMRLAIRQGYTNRISRQARMPVEIFDLDRRTRKERATILANSALLLFKAMIAAEGDRGEGLNLINIAALDLSIHRPATSISGFFNESNTSESARMWQHTTRADSSTATGDNDLMLALAESARHAQELKVPAVAPPIDLTFLKELPIEIRAEIAAEYGISPDEITSGADSSFKAVHPYDGHADTNALQGDLCLPMSQTGLDSFTREDAEGLDNLVCTTCGTAMPAWLQHDHVRWPATGLSSVYSRLHDDEDEPLTTQDSRLTAGRSPSPQSITDSVGDII